MNSVYSDRHYESSGRALTRFHVSQQGLKLSRKHHTFVYDDVTSEIVYF